MDFKNKLTKASRHRLSGTGRGVTVKYVSRSGHKRCHGGPRLKETQAYTIEFGRKVAALHKSTTIRTIMQDPARRVTYTTYPDQNTICR